MAYSQPLAAQAQLAYDAASKSPCPDWRAVAELFRAAVAANRKRAPKANTQEIADYNVDHLKLKALSPRLCVRFMDGEAIFTHRVASSPSD